ncbi:MAG: DUF1775 domain-containing protein [Betaproteobacteria bacterium]|nr:DUF1775 domain-containing protein [Betaproteobacteria bacterium]NBS48413.1 DUF1775 domain-containing protein [Betaproteobacteria bacterium]
MQLRLIAATLVILASAARAHPTLEQPAGVAGKSYKAVFRIAHGCGASPTREIEVDIPSGVRGARPMPKPGWQLVAERAQLQSPYTSHGRRVTEDTVRVRWTARSVDDMLPNAHYDEFVIMVVLPDLPGPVYWPLRQVCEQGRTDWVNVPLLGRESSSVKDPAPLLQVMPQARPTMSPAHSSGAIHAPAAP